MPKGMLLNILAQVLGLGGTYMLFTLYQQNDRKKFMELYNGIVQTLEKPEKVNKLVLSDNLMDFLNQLLEK